MILLVCLAILGLIWFIAELKPSAPRRVRMGSGTYVTRSVVEDEVSRSPSRYPDVLGSSARVKARRRPGAQVDLEARVQAGRDLRHQVGPARTVRERLSSEGPAGEQAQRQARRSRPETDEDEGTVNAFNRLILLILALLLLAVPVLLSAHDLRGSPGRRRTPYTGYRAPSGPRQPLALPTTGACDRDRDRRRARRPDSAAASAQGADLRTQGLEEHRDGRRAWQGDRDHGQRREDPRRERGEGGGSTNPLPSR